MQAKRSICSASALALGLCATVVVSAQLPNPQVLETRSTVDRSQGGEPLSGKADGKGDRPLGAAPTAAAAAVNTTGNGIDYHGGPVMLNTVRMYYIWYGTWDSASKSILTNFANGLGGSPYFNINTTYFAGSNTNVSNSVSYGGSATDNYSLGKALSDADVGTIVSKVLANGSLPTDPNGVYFVLTSSDVTETSGFTTAYCAWHAWNFLNGANIKYAFIGDASVIKPQACSVQTTSSPNGNPAVDAMVSLVAHEFEESVTDPNLNAWYDSAGEETADKCAWMFGTVYQLPNGSHANMNLGGHDFLIQENWVNAADGYCALSAEPDTAAAVTGTGGTATHITARASLAVVKTSTVSGSLAGSGDSNITGANLTTEGTGDWVHWGDSSLNRKAGVTALLSSYTLVGGGSATVYTNDPRPLSWTDGTPTVSSAGNLKGIYNSGTGRGFSFTGPADTNSRTLVVHVGGWNSGGTLTAHLSDTSAADFTNTTSTASGQYDRNYTLTYRAGSAAQTLTVTWKMASGTGNVTLNGAALSGVTAVVPNITATGGVTQSATIGTAFASPLQATVKDASNNPISGAAVTFTAPASGASGAFGGSATVNTDINGVATAPAFTANTIAGHYSVVASTPGASSTASFSLTNLAGAPSSIAATFGTPQSAAAGTPFASLLVATVKDLGGNLVSGATVTFTAPGSGASGTFTGGSTTANVLTIGNGTATAPVFTANGLTGAYAVVASAAGVSPSASFSLTNNALGVTGSLSGAGDSNATGANLTTEGTTDWVHWGDASLNRKAGVAAQISTYTVLGSGGVLMYTNDARPLSWTDGTPTVSSANNLDGNYIRGVGNGFSITAPADTISRTLILHLGGWFSGGTLTAHLSDASAADFVDSTAAVAAPFDRNYTLNYQAGSAGQSLTVTWVMTSAPPGDILGNVTLNGAALVASSAPTATSIATTGGTPQIVTIGATFPSPLTAIVKDVNSNPVNGAAVTFTAPGSGAGGTFSGSGTAVTVNTDVSGVATAPAFTANTTAGSYSVSASTPGVAAAATFSLTNQAGAPSSVAATSGTPQSTAINTAFASPLVATVKDSGGNLLSGVTVTFTASGSGASGTFTGGSATATVITIGNGTATAPSFTANGSAGGYAVVASVVGVSPSANFSLTNQSAAPSSVAATSGTPQNATISTAFASPLVATVKDSGGNPLNGVMVTFTAPGTGASGTFMGGAATATAMTIANGTATGPSFTANGSAGGYAVVASVSGVSPSASFSLTNLAGAPSSVTATSGTPQSATISTAFASPLVATVKDTGGNLLSGVMVTFTAPGSGASGTFTGGSTTANALTIANGTATSPAFSANGSAGGYAVVASVVGVSPSANFNLTNNTLGTSGSLSGAGDSNTAAANLTTEGTGDWVHWGDASLNRKASVAAQISTYTAVGGGTATTYSNDPRPLSWTDGTPTASSTNNFKGIYISGTGKGFSFTAPADTASRTLKVHVGGWNSGGTLTAHLSDGSAPDYINATSTASGSYDRNYTLTYQAGASGKNLMVIWQMNAGSGNVTLNGAAVTVVNGPSITASAGTPQSTTIGTAFASPLQVTVKDASNNPINGAAVTFTAPASGASGTFSGSGTATAVTDASGIATAPALTANGQAGTWTPLASTPGISTPASFNLSNLAGAPANISATGGTPQSTIINALFATPLQATVKDANNNAVSGVTVTFAAPASGAAATFSGLTTATAITNASGIATAPALTANGQAGSYTVTATAAGVDTSTSFSLTNSTAPPVPIKLVQQAHIDSMIDIPSESLSFASPNTAGNWIGVAIFGGQSNTHLFTVTDSNGNIYNRALTAGNTHDDITLGMYFAENIKGGANQIKVVPDHSAYIRVVIVEYSGLATVGSLDVTASAQGGSVSPNSGTVSTTANGDLLWGACASADAEPFAGAGYTLDTLVPAAPGTALTTEDQIQTTAGPTSASLRFGSAKDWAMGLAAFRRAP